MCSAVFWASGGLGKTKIETPNLIVYEDHGLVIHQYPMIQPISVGLSYLPNASRGLSLMLYLNIIFGKVVNCTLRTTFPQCNGADYRRQEHDLRTRQYCGGRLYFGTNAPVLDELTTEISDTKAKSMPRRKYLWWCSGIMIQVSRMTRHDPNWPYQFHRRAPLADDVQPR